MRLITFGIPGNWTAAFEIDGRAVTLDRASRAAGWAETGLTNRRLLAMGPGKMEELARAAADLPGKLVSIDGVNLQELDFVDVGEIIDPPGVVPVVIKSLLFS